MTKGETGRLRESLERVGWHALRFGTQQVSDEAVRRVAESIGTIVAEPGRPKIQSLSPRDEHMASPGSLSRQFGRGMLPFHCDTAHWIVPSRYLVMGCINPGEVSTPTMLLDAGDPSFSDQESLLLRSSCFLVRNGCRSFYATIADRTRPFVRVDPGCMEPLDEDGVRALELYGLERQGHRAVKHDWQENDVLVIDNWRILHGRGNDLPTDPNRVLMRAYVQ
ncbi:TauD/TfdA family dioxygenase [Tardiphaga sp. P9-11]|uniref:TauD/TfdA family dioxygenase n=1 Tax=Tardiphaga sp. P9-11 TaxID=2024614 RepID=UPI0011F16424|nr:TauD/TfdA family dioxygenase [Tardiphaga sp. P9-11]KAA0070011.1 hypothetical protein CIW50_28015 [Tardiphaga sp. P9-11]